AGAILGAVAFLIGMPDFPAADIITAIAVGIVSGLAATGVDQAIKQLKGGE
ncbi:MAG: phage holin family protein, partial [Lachnospiraceae bacterium]|nr:phage holin family protein [Lachnospiraceae bacterium]